MYKINGIMLEDLTYSTVFKIAWDLGCNIEMSPLEQSKYIYGNTAFTDDEWLEEKNRCDEINKQRFDKFNDDVFNWLKDRDYIIEVNDLPHDSCSWSEGRRPSNRLIDADRLFTKVGRIKPKNKQQYEDIGMFMNMITNSRTHEGLWVLDTSDNSVSCSECDCMIYPNDIMYGDALYCPNCGREMKLKMD